MTEAEHLCERAQLHNADGQNGFVADVISDEACFSALKRV